MDIERIEKAVKEIIIAIGEDPERSGLKASPKRIALAYKKIFNGINRDPEKEIQDFLEDKYHDLIILKNLEFMSICEHHLMPFFGKINIAYLPNDQGNIVSFGRIREIVKILCSRPQIQERLNNEIAEVLYKKLEAKALVVSIEALHVCMMIDDMKKSPEIKTIRSLGQEIPNLCF